MLKDGQLLSLAQNNPAGLILQKPYYAEYIGPGAAIGGMFDLQCVTIHTLGKAELTVPETLDERQDAFQRRMEDIEKMQQICEQDLPIERAVAVLEMLSQHFHQEEIQTISNDILAKLVGVLPSTMAAAWQQLSHSNRQRNLSPQPSQEEAALASHEVAFA
ncbi:hypothetical protein [Acaryochloris sp. IP29b_bin.148]|uniref:hypothetical protein n=1 Tax=Acaryochloris sp. IP29b_bin.148 TaxID=2969218 RepID=UPI0026141931|nr:hypothetical protein [Acaryochloris sp. IP29b_bin.148]